MAKRDLEEKKISFIRYAISLAVDIYSRVLTVSKIGRLVFMLERIKKMITGQLRGRLAYLYTMVLKYISEIVRRGMRVRRSS